MSPQSRFAVTVALLLPAAALGADDRPLADQARKVLRTHCLRCHGNREHGGLNVLDRGELIARGQIVPGSPGGSLLLDLVNGGSMPPGKLAKVPAEDRKTLARWVQAGAPAFSREIGRDYLLGSLLDDFEKLDESARKQARYISFNHLPAGKIAAQLAGLKTVLSKLGDEKFTPASVGDSGTLFRIDLKQLHWDEQPFDNSKLTLYDLVLLEYPYGVLPRLPLPSKLAAFLEKTEQVRPIPYVRGDWLVWALSRLRLLKDFLEARKKPQEALHVAEAIKPFTASISWAEAERELETSPDGERLKSVLEKIPELAPLAQKKSVDRATWESRYLKVVRLLDGGLPILPLDALTWTNPTAVPGLTVKLRLIDAKDQKKPDPAAKERIVAKKDKPVIWILSNKEVLFELISTAPNGRKRLLTSAKEADFLNADEPLVSPPPEWRDRLSSTERRYLSLYAYPDADLKKETPYPQGKLLRGRVADRFVHPFYELTPGGKALKGPEPARMVKVNFSFVVVNP